MWGNSMYIPCIYTGTEVLDSGYGAKRLRFSWNKHGANVCTYTLPNKGFEKLRYAIRQGGAMLDVMGDGGLVWRGRVSAATLEQDAVSITAHGLQDEFNHVRVFHSWINTKVSDWVQAVDKNDSLYPFTQARKNQQFICDNNNRLYIALVNGNTYSANASAAWYLLPVHSPVYENASAPLWTRPIRRIKANYEMLVPSGFEWRIVGEHANNPPNSYDIVVWNTLVGTGVLQTGSVNIDVSANPRYTVRMILVNNTGSSYTMSGETGSMYLRLTGVEVITGTGAVAAGVVRSSEIVRNMALLVGTQRGITLNASSSTVAEMELDLMHEVYNDKTAYEIMERMADYGDLNGRRANWWVDNDYSVHLRQTQSGGRTLIVRSIDAQTRYTLRSIANRYYAVYNNPGGYPLRTEWVNDAVGQRVHGVIRTQAFETQTTSAVQASKVANSMYDASRGVNSQMTVTFIATTNGNQFPFWQIRAGDIVHDLNQLALCQPGQFSTDVFYVAGWEYDEDSDTITLYPEEEIDSVDRMLSKI